jgi:hypothetical protein
MEEGLALPQLVGAAPGAGVAVGAEKWFSFVLPSSPLPVLDL